MRITILVDNNTRSDLKPEWGLAVYIGYNGHKILLDAGWTGIFAENSEMLGISVDEIEAAVLSHAHYDHSDGLETFFQKNGRAKCYLRSCCGENCFDLKGKEKYIGIQKGYLEKYADRLVRVEGDYKLFPGVWLVPHKTPGLEKQGEKAGMYLRKGNAFVPDSFEHEQSLVFETEKGLVILNSCSHGGADNIIAEIKETFPEQKIHALIGGLHLFKSSDEEVLTLAKKVRETGIEKIYTGHCTGERAMELLQKELGDMVEQIYTGMEIEI